MSVSEQQEYNGNQKQVIDHQLLLPRLHQQPEQKEEGGKREEKKKQSIPGSAERVLIFACFSLSGKRKERKR